MDRQRWLLGFDDPAARDPRVTGGKGSSLARLLQAGFPVPPGFVVTAEADRQFRLQDPGFAGVLAGLDFENPEALRRQCDEIRSGLTHRALPDSLVEQVSRELPALLARGAVAVRSSSTLEDLVGSAFAGQHDTFLNCAGLESVLDSVKRCLASLWEDRAVRYRHERGYGQEAAAMAVVIQLMVQSESAGVVFTIHPITGDPSQMLVNSAWGLGETVVSGEGDVDQFVLSRSSGQAVEARIARKDRAIVSDTDGTRAAQVTAERTASASLTSSELEQIWKLSLEAERFAGFPQDIEWGTAGGRVFLLQSRPITKLPDRWTRDESAERFPNVVTPLSWDYAAEAFHRSLAHSLQLMGLPAFSGRWFERFDGYIYGNQTAVRLFTTGTPLFQTLDELRELVPHLRENYSWVERLPTAWARDLDRYLLRLGALSAVDLTELSEAELRTVIDSISAVGSEYFLPNIAISLTHAL